MIISDVISDRERVSDDLTSLRSALREFKDNGALVGSHIEATVAGWSDGLSVGYRFGNL